MDSRVVEKLSQSEKYKKLVRVRTRYGWFMTSLVLVVYFGFIYLVAFHKEFLAQKISSNSIITISIPIGIGVILFTVFLTGIYVRRANSEFDSLTAEIKGELK